MPLCSTCNHHLNTDLPVRASHRNTSRRDRHLRQVLVKYLTKLCITGFAGDCVRLHCIAEGEQYGVLLCTHKERLPRNKEKRDEFVLTQIQTIPARREVKKVMYFFTFTQFING